MTESTVLYGVKKRIAYITLNRPKKSNAFNLEMSYALRDAWKRFENDPKALVAILSGNGKSFSVGVDLTDEDRKTGKPLTETLQNLGLDDIVGDLWKREA